MSAHAAAASRALRSTAPHAGLTELCGGPFICGGNLEQFSLLRAESFWPACARSACCARIVAGRELLQLLQRAHALPRHRHGVYLRTTSRVTFTTIANLALCTAVAQAEPLRMASHVEQPLRQHEHGAAHQEMPHDARRRSPWRCTAWHCVQLAPAGSPSAP